MIQKVQGSYIFRLSLWIMLVSLLVAATAGLMMLAWLTRRLKRLAIAMQACSDGTLFERLHLPAPEGRDPGDEIKRLETTSAGWRAGSRSRFSRSAIPIRGGAIDVESTLHSGTSFTFALWTHHPGL